MIIYREIVVQNDPSWPRYQLICGEVKRLLEPEAVPEVLRDDQWVEEKLLA